MVEGIDLRSDTVTRPTDRMRRAAAEATVGDDVHRDDPTVARLEAHAADLVGMEAALYVPSGTMGNQIAGQVHADPGQEVLLEVESHVYKWELAGLARHGALQTRPIDGGERGVIEPGQVRAGVVEPDAHRPGTGLLCLENTHNSRGGSAIAPGAIEAAARAAHERDVPVHLDGARVFNAAVARDVPAARLCEPVDSVMFCLSKGLGAPVGSMLAGSEAFVAAARRVRKRMGGGMRQAGIIAAPGLVALENRDHLAADHEHATRLARGLADIPGLDPGDPETNILLVDVAGAAGEGSAAVSEETPAERVLGRWAAAGVHGVAVGRSQVRFCTHRDVTRDGVDTAVERIAGAT